jgi:hypothetical protein
MHTLSLENVLRWTAWNQKWAPQSVAIRCPFCRRLAAFTLKDYSFDPLRNTISASSECPACRETIRLWLLDPGASPEEKNKTCRELCICPMPSNDLEPMSGGDKIPSEIGKEYTSAINVFNAGEWNATAICCRRVLEAIVQNLLPKEAQRGRLIEQLGALQSNVDLTKPLTSLTDALRRGGNLGAHFNLEMEPDQATARQMLYFVEYLMRYLYVLPGEAESFHNDITKQGQETVQPGNAG